MGKKGLIPNNTPELWGIEDAENHIQALEPQKHSKEDTSIIRTKGSGVVVGGLGGLLVLCGGVCGVGGTWGGVGVGFGCFLGKTRTLWSLEEGDAQGIQRSERRRGGKSG